MSSTTFNADIFARASSIDHVLRTNTAPSSLEAVEIRCLLHEVEFELTKMRYFSATSSQHFLMLETLAVSCTSSLSILRRMPSEMLCAIFSLTIPEPYDFINQPLNSMDARQSPSVLTQVCRSWRTIALSHNELWSHIHINLEMVSSHSKPLPKLSTLELFLERSGAHSLYIHFGDFYAPHSTATEFLPALMSHSNRWKEVTFFSEFSRLQMLEDIRGRVPSLYRLVVHAFGAQTYGPLHAFEDAPQLRQAVLCVGDPLAALPLPWFQLTGIGGLFDYASLLPHTPNLVEFSMESGPSLTAPSPVRHLSLKKLHVHADNILDWLEAPALEVLQLHSSRELFTPRNATSFIVKSGCVLQSLSLCNIIDFSNWADIKGLWMSIPSLTTLQISFCAFDWDTFSNQLSSTQPGASALLPDLQRIVCIFIKRDRFYLPDSVLDLLESRRQLSRSTSNRRVAQLLSAGLFNVNISQESRGRLAALQDRGLTITLGTKRRDR